MNVAIIIAGGVGSRTGNKIPKQFKNVYLKFQEKTKTLKK